MPAAVARRPRDHRGIPVPAITRWERGAPMFTEASGDRQLLCALRNRCSVCGGPMEDGDGVWHVVDDKAAKWISYALRRGAEPAGVFTTFEVPGHYACMLYAVIACPFLAFPSARRTVDGVGASGHEVEVAAGTRRGQLSALVEFTTCAVRTTPETGGYEVVMARPRTIHTYQNGTELLPLLDDAVAAESPLTAPQRQVEWFGPDEKVVIRELRRTLEASPAVHSRG